VAREGDDQLIETIRIALESGQINLHVTYRRARRVDGFREALVAQVGERSVRFRDHFLKVGLSVLVVWFAIAQTFRLEETTVRILGTPVTVSLLTFALILLGIVMFSRQYIKPMLGRPMHRAAMHSTDLFIELWQTGALALIARSGSDRLCQSPKADWRQYVQQTLMFGE
jgi:hypothetical protein